MPQDLPNVSDNTFNCPITQQRMTDPLITPYGHSYEAEAILTWLSLQSICPITRQDLNASNLRINHELREQMGLPAIEDRAFSDADLIAHQDNGTDLSNRISQINRDLWDFLNQGPRLESFPAAITRENNNKLLVYRFGYSINIQTNGESIAIERPSDNLELWGIAAGIECSVLSTDNTGTASLTPRGEHFANPDQEAEYLRYQRHHQENRMAFSDEALQCYHNITHKEIRFTHEESVYDATSGRRVRHSLRSS